MPQDETPNTREVKRSALSSALIVIAVLVLIGGGAFAGYVAFSKKNLGSNSTAAKPATAFCATDFYKESLDCKPIDQADCLLIQELYNHYQNYTFDKEKLTMVHLEQWFSQCQFQEQAKLNPFINSQNSDSIASEDSKCPPGQIFDTDAQDCIPDNSLDEKIRTAYGDKSWDQYLQLNFQKLEQGEVTATLTDKLKLEILFARDFYKKYQAENPKDQKSLTQIKAEIEKLQDAFIKSCPDCFDLVKACSDVQNLYIEAREGSPYKKTGIAGFAMTRYQKAPTMPGVTTPGAPAPKPAIDPNSATSELSKLTFDQFFEQADFYQKYCLKAPIQN